MADSASKRPPQSREDVLKKLQQLAPADRLAVLEALKADRAEKRLIELEERIAALKSRQSELGL